VPELTVLISVTDVSSGASYLQQIQVAEGRSQRAEGEVTGRLGDWATERLRETCQRPKDLAESVKERGRY